MNEQSSGNNKMMWVVVTVVVLILGSAGFIMRSQIRSLLMGQQPAQESAVTSSPPGQTSPPANETPVQNNTGPETTVTAQVVEVDYTLAGFTPKSVTVKKGTTVRFINKTTEPMDVASNPHPIHTDYPEFDQYKSASAGRAEYNFTFDKVGTWGYHNHFKAADGGTVVVTE